MPPYQSAMSNHQNLHTRLDTPPSSSDLRLTTISLNHGQSTTTPRPPSAAIAKRTSHTQVSLMWGLLTLLIAARADGYLIPAYPPPLPHLRKRDESESNVIGYSGLVIAAIGVIVAALGVFKGRKLKCWKDRRSSKKEVCIFLPCTFWWW